MAQATMFAENGWKLSSNDPTFHLGGGQCVSPAIHARRSRRARRFHFFSIFRETLPQKRRIA